MSDINSVCMSGRLTKDVELKYGQSGTAIAVFTIATERAVKRGDKWEKEASFFDVKMFGKPAEWLYQNTKKGAQVTIQGQAVQERWEDKTTGDKRSKVVILADVATYHREARAEVPGFESEPEPSGSAFKGDDIPF